MKERYLIAGIGADNIRYEIWRNVSLDHAHDGRIWYEVRKPNDKIMFEADTYEVAERYITEVLLKGEQMEFTREDIAKVMRETQRRIDDDIHDGIIPQNARYIRAELASRMQGVYGTIMSVVPNRNWCDVVWWLDDELEELYEWYGLGRLYNDDGTKNQ